MIYVIDMLDPSNPVRYDVEPTLMPRGKHHVFAYIRFPGTIYTSWLFRGSSSHCSTFLSSRSTTSWFSHLSRFHFAFHPQALVEAARDACCLPSYSDTLALFPDFPELHL